MIGSARLAIAAVGLAIGIYGIASLTGGWLGTPPWFAYSQRGSLLLEKRPNSGRNIASALVVSLGSTLVVGATWRYRTTRAFRAALGVFGLAVAVYGLSTLTGEWLGRPSWWWQVGPFANEDGVPILSESESHGAISVLVALGGVGMLALAMLYRWPRRVGPP